MEHQNLQASREALTAIKRIVGDALQSPHCVRPTVPKIMLMSRTELASGLKRLQHAQLCHYLRCDASREVLLMIREAVEETIQLLDAGDGQTAKELEMWEPFRHRLYASVTVVALCTAEREAIKRERDYWRRRNAMRIAPVYRVAIGVYPTGGFKLTRYLAVALDLKRRLGIRIAYGMVHKCRNGDSTI